MNEGKFKLDSDENQVRDFYISIDRYIAIKPNLNESIISMSTLIVCKFTHLLSSIRSSESIRQLSTFNRANESLGKHDSENFLQKEAGFLAKENEVRLIHFLSCYKITITNIVHYIT